MIENIDPLVVLLDHTYRVKLIIDLNENESKWLNRLLSLTEEREGT